METTFIASLIYTAIAVCSIIYINETKDRRNLRYVERQLLVFTFVFIAIPIIILDCHLRFGHSFALDVAFVISGILGASITTWDREIKVYPSIENGWKLKRYRFILPIGVYSKESQFDSLTEWVKFIVDPFSYIIEFHEENQDRKNRKFCVRVENGTPTNDIMQDSHMKHTCILCESAYDTYIPVESCWNNPREYKTHNTDICQSCFVQLMDRAEEDIREFDFDKSKILVANI